MNLDGIKQWLEEAIEFFNEAKDGKRRDIQQNIVENRRLFGVPYRKREEMKTWVQANKPNVLPYLVELATWMKDYYLYFTPAYRPVSGETIDTLPTKILDRLQWIREKIESL